MRNYNSAGSSVSKTTASETFRNRWSGYTPIPEIITTQKLIIEN